MGGCICFKNYYSGFMEFLNLDRTAAACRALGHPQRLGLLVRLLSAPEGGLGFGALGAEVGMPPSTLTHHLRELEDAGLIRRTPQGRASWIAPQTEALTAMIAAVTRLCCPPLSGDDK